MSAQQLGQDAVIYMPKISAQNALTYSTSVAMPSSRTYDDTVRLTMARAAAAGEVVQDTRTGPAKSLAQDHAGRCAALADEAVELAREEWA